MEVPQGRINALREYTDPWGTPYKIDLSDPEAPRAYSFGKNKTDEHGKGDDLVSW